MDGAEGGQLPIVGIVGGHGGMGRLFARLLAASGATVLVSDRHTALTNLELVSHCDLTLVATPLRVIPAVLAELAPRVGPDRGVVSLGSLMEHAAAALRPCAGETVLLHPLFGPGRKDLRRAHLAMAMTGGHGGRRQAWLLAWLRAQGADVVTTTPDEHDRVMAVAQALLHGGYAAFAPVAMRALPAADPLVWASPTLRLHLALMSRILHQDPQLYGDLLALNRHTPAAIDLLVERLTTLRAAALDGPDAVAAYFAAAREELGPAGPMLAAEGDRALGEDPV